MTDRPTPEPCLAEPPPAADRTGRLTADRDRFVSFAFAAADLLAEVTPDGRIAFAAGAFRSRLGLAPEALVGAPAELLVDAEDRPTLMACMALAAERGRVPPMALRLADAARTRFFVSAMGRLAPPGEQGAHLCLSFGPLPEAAPELAAPLLLGAASLRRQAEAKLAGEGASGAALGLLELIETGQGAGAALPAGLAEEMRQALARHGAAELGEGRFGLLLEDPRGLEALAGQIEAVLRGAGRDAPALLQHSLPLGRGGLSAPQAVRALRHALDEFARGTAPRPGGLPALAARLLAKAGTLRQAITDRRFRLQYQPIVSLATRELHHYEALLRPFPVAGADFSGPQGFVGAAELAGLAPELDLAVAEAALEARRTAGAARIAVNASGLSLQEPAFRARLLALLDGARGQEDHLLIEVTETTEIEDIAEAAATVDRLRARGVPVCIDDFGAGAAAFRYLRSLQVDYVKVDGAYVRGAAASARDRAFVASMIDLSRAVGARAIAEQVETEETARDMRALGVELAQGFLFGRPGTLPARQTAAARRRGEVVERWG